MRDKIDKLLEEIKAEAMQEAIDSIAANMVESASGMWEAIKQYCGEKEAALAVMCLLQEAVEDGVIVATKFANPADDDDAATVTLRMTVYDETATMIEGTDGICIEVAYSVTTNTALAEALPDLVRFVPVDEPRIKKMLPVARRGLFDDLKALGLEVEE